MQSSAAERTAEIYEAILPVLKDLETERISARNYANNMKVGLALSALVGSVVGVSIAVANAFPLHFAFIANVAVWGMICLFIYSLSAGRRVAQYKQNYKNHVVSDLAQRIQPGMKYSAIGGIPLKVFEGSQLFSQRAERYSSEDEFKGQIGKTELRFAEVHAEESRRSRKKRRYVTFFRGVFFVADFHKHFRSSVFVLPDVAESALGLLGKQFQSFRPFSNHKLIYMEDAEFEKRFVVYGTDQVDARYILSSSMLQRIVELQTKWRDDVRIRFHGTQVTIAISNKSNLFEPRLHETAIDKGRIQQLLFEIEFCFDIVNDLNLNTRIWTKE